MTSISRMVLAACWFENCRFGSCLRSQLRKEKSAVDAAFYFSLQSSTDESAESGDVANENSCEVLKLFVYGTLKRGFWNHDAFCRGFMEVREATVRGRLYEGPGYPILEVPEADILAQGSTDPLADAATQARLSHRVQAGPQRLPEGAEGEAWDTVYGELFTFDDPRTRLPPIDRLEGFHPGSRCLYRRVLVPACVAGVRQIVWVYVVEKLGISRDRIASGRWPN